METIAKARELVGDYHSVMESHYQRLVEVLEQPADRFAANLGKVVNDMHYTLDEMKRNNVPSDVVEAYKDRGARVIERWFCPNHLKY